MHPSTAHLLQFFGFAHLPPHLAAVSEPFFHLAHRLTEDVPENPELTAGLRKLLEAKDCAVRAAMSAQDPVRALKLDAAFTPPCAICGEPIGDRSCHGEGVCDTVDGKVRAAARAVGRKIDIAAELAGAASLCVECGPNVRVDEDGCCTSCGSQAMGAWLDALRAAGRQPG